ncbi:Cysteine synthase 2 [Bienertia sinuspersici]
MAPMICNNGAMFATLSYVLLNKQQTSKHPKSKTQKPNCSKKYGSGIVGAIGNTPLIRINSLSNATGCEILGKAEFLNPGGSVKDRIAVKIIEESQTLEALGATVERVRPVSITHRDHFVNVARRRASEANEQAAKLGKHIQTCNNEQEQTNGETFEEQKKNYVFSSSCTGGFFADQFENLANFRAHYEGTGPEIWEQTEGKLDAFVAAAGTGGTVAGEKNANIKCFLIDPPGSGLFNRVTRGVMLTQNFMMAKLNGAFQGTDKEAVEMSSSSAMNCVGAVRVAQKLGPGNTIVTILCDSGMRHLSRFYKAEYLSQLGLSPSANGLEFLGLSAEER